MIIVVGLQAMVIMPSDLVDFDNDAQDQEVQGVRVDLEHEESLSDQTDLAFDGEDRTTEIAISTPLWDFRMISNSWLVQTVVGIGLFMIVYRWYKNDPAK